MTAAWLALAAALGIALAGLWRAARHALRRQATWALARATAESPAQAERAAAFARFRTTPALRDAVLDRDPAAAETRRLALEWLDHWERVAVALRAGLLEERLARALLGAALLRDLGAGRPLIGQARNPGPEGDGDPAAYAALEEQAVRWGAPRIRLPWYTRR